LIDCILDLLLRERVTQSLQVWVIKVNGFPVEVSCACTTPSHDRMEVIMHNLLLSSMIGNPPIVVLDAVNEVLPSSSMNP
jgi:hypothetical protein